MFTQATRYQQNCLFVSIIGLCCVNAIFARTFDEQTPPNLLAAVTTAVASTITPATTQAPAEPQLNTTCFTAEADLCQTFNESEPCRECMPHPIYSNSLVCCNVTDLEKAISCVPSPQGENGTSWTNIHIRNATLDELDISHKFWKRLNSLSITDGNITRIVKEFPKFSTPRCLNMSNNNISEIPQRAFTVLTRLQVLDLSHNNLTTIPNLNSQTNLQLDVQYVTYKTWMLSLPIWILFLKFRGKLFAFVICSFI